MIGSTAGGALVVALSVLMLFVPLLGVREAYVAHDRSEAYAARKIIEAVASKVEEGATVLHHRSPLWYMVLVEGRRRDLTLIDPFCTSWDRHTDVIWPDQISASGTAGRYGTGDTTGVEAARRAARSGPVYLLANGRARLDSFHEAGFDVVPVEKDGFLYKLVPRVPNLGNDPDRRGTPLGVNYGHKTREHYEPRRSGVRPGAVS